MIRPAKFGDVPRIVELLCEAHAKSRYAVITPVSEQAAHKLVASCVQRHGHTTVGGAFVMVAENSAGEVSGFVIGLLDRLYHIGEKLSANDLFLYADGVGMAPVLLFKSYIAWAEGNPNVAEIHASWTDAVPGAERAAAIYKAAGFEKSGEIWKRGAI